MRLFSEKVKDVEVELCRRDVDMHRIQQSDIKDIETQINSQADFSFSISDLKAKDHKATICSDPKHMVPEKDSH